MPDRFHHHFRLKERLAVREADDTESEAAQRFVSMGIATGSIGFAMLRAVQLDHQHMTEAAEIQDVARDWMLPAELDPKLATSQSLPQTALGVRLVAPKPSCPLRRCLKWLIPDHDRVGWLGHAMIFGRTGAKLLWVCGLTPSSPSPSLSLRERSL